MPNLPMQNYNRVLHVEKLDTGLKIAGKRSIIWITLNHDNDCPDLSDGTENEKEILKCYRKNFIRGTEIYAAKR